MQCEAATKEKMAIEPVPARRCRAHRFVVLGRRLGKQGIHWYVQGRSVVFRVPAIHGCDIKLSWKESDLTTGVKFITYVPNVICPTFEVPKRLAVKPQVATVMTAGRSTSCRSSPTISAAESKQQSGAFPGPPS